jgi:hypothetical protein
MASRSGLAQSCWFASAAPCVRSSADGWAMVPTGLRGAVNDAVAIYFRDAALAAALMSRWCAGSKVEIRRGFPGARGSAGTARSSLMVRTSDRGANLLSRN